jgi:catechol 2,3-dioxygenase-like lactoylglutathione lyase family enzyme
MMHHISIRTANIHRSIAFYQLLGFEVKERFTTGYTLACWLEGLGGRLELIQIPEPKSAPDSFFDEHYVGYYHISFDLSQYTTDLSVWLEELQSKFQQQVESETNSLKSLSILLPPEQQMIGNHVYEVTFLADSDGLPLEFIRLIK